MYSLSELEGFLKKAGADFEIMHQSKPILSVAEAKEFYNIDKAAPTFILQSESGLIACIYDDSLLAFDYIYGGTGYELETLKINPADVKSLNHIIGTI